MSKSVQITERTTLSQLREILWTRGLDVSVHYVPIGPIERAWRVVVTGQRNYGDGMHTDAVAADGVTVAEALCRVVSKWDDRVI